MPHIQFQFQIEYPNIANAYHNEPIHLLSLPHSEAQLSATAEHFRSGVARLNFVWAKSNALSVNGPFIPQRQYYVCWYPVAVRSQCLSTHGISHEYYIISITRFNLSSFIGRQPDEPSGSLAASNGVHYNLFKLYMSFINYHVSLLEIKLLQQLPSVNEYPR